LDGVSFFFLYFTNKFNGSSSSARGEIAFITSPLPVKVTVSTPFPKTGEETAPLGRFFLGRDVERGSGPLPPYREGGGYSAREDFEEKNEAGKSIVFFFPARKRSGACRTAEGRSGMSPSVLKKSLPPLRIFIYDFQSFLMINLPFPLILMDPRASQESAFLSITKKGDDQEKTPQGFSLPCKEGTFGGRSKRKPSPFLPRRKCVGETANLPPPPP